MSVQVLKPGMLSTFQDLGRIGSQHLGVPVCGAMDSRSHRFANLLVGNPPGTATLEITLIGPTLLFEESCCLAICGADLSPALNGVPILAHRPVLARAGDVLSFGARRSGARAYIAWHGGPRLKAVLGSMSTDRRAGFGGLDGRALVAGDRFALERALDPARSEAIHRLAEDLRVVLPAPLVPLAPDAPLRLIRHPMADLFEADAWTRLVSADFAIHAASDRMGYRLEGPPLTLRDRTPLLSEGTSMGTVQVPPDGRAIVLMADRQATGGYAKIASVAGVDLPALAQRNPGEVLRFTPIELEHARALLARREAAFQRLDMQLGRLRAALRDAASPPDR